MKRLRLSLGLSLLLSAAVLMTSCGGGSTTNQASLPGPGSGPTPAPFDGGLGSVQLGSAETCPSNLNFDPGMTCYHATVSTCPNALDLGLTFGYRAPAGTPKGTIVFFTGSGGESAGDDQFNAYSDDYVNADYAVVETAWDGPWEDTTNATTGSNVPLHSVINAGCRPATFLNYIFTQSQFYTQGTGRCAQGFSGGTGALGYSLAAYGMDAQLDKVVLQSGPVFSDIQQGCEVPPAPNVTVCGSGDPWCQLGSQPAWTLSPSYSGKTAGAVQDFTGDTSCSGATATSSASNTNWKAQSIVNGSTKMNFSFPNTPITAWLCATETAGSGGPNNSTPQGEIFYEQVGPTGSPLKVYAVQNCNGSEGVDPGTVPALSNESTHTAVVDDMTLGTLNGNACVKTH